MNDSEISLSENTKFLGTIVDERLDFTAQVNNVCSKLGRTMYAIRTLKNTITDNSLLNVYYAQAYSIICYNIIVWGQSTDASRIFILQKRIIRVIFYLDYRQSCRDTFKNKGILTFTSIYLFKLLCYIYSKKDALEKNSNFHQYNTRKKGDFCLKKAYHSKYQKSPFYAGCKYFNMLPEHLKLITVFNEFKKKLKLFLIENCFYTLTEFISYNQIL